MRFAYTFTGLLIAVLLQSCAAPQTPQLAECSLYAKTCFEKAPDMGGIRNCQRHADCVLHRLDCCGCNQGGEHYSVRRDMVDHWDAWLAKSCATTVCTSNEVCLEGMRPACMGGRCQLVYLKDGEVVTAPEPAY